ncbi:hypothetical protein BH20GEM1_BH20GEM1_14560 [soil metagenome]
MAEARFEVIELPNRRKFLQLSGAALAVATVGAACDDDNNGITPPPDDDPVVTLPLQNETDILKFALFLELLEEDFYIKAVQSGVLSGAVATLATNVRDHESAHVDAIQAALGAMAFTQDDVEFDFGSSLASQASFLATAVTLEQTGVGAYLGALPLIQSRSLRTTAGSIFTIEARHTAAFRAFNNAPGGPVPAAFESPLTPQQVVTAVVNTGFVVDGL